MLWPLGDKKANKAANMTEIMFLRGGGGGARGGVNEMQFLIFQQNNVNPCEIYNN